LNFATAASETQAVNFSIGSLSISQDEGQSGTTDYVSPWSAPAARRRCQFLRRLVSASTDSADYHGRQARLFSVRSRTARAPQIVTIQFGDTVVKTTKPSL